MRGSKSLRRWLRMQPPGCTCYACSPRGRVQRWRKHKDEARVSVDLASGGEA